MSQDKQLQVFLDSVRTSKLLDAEQLSQLAAAEASHTHPQTLADMLEKNGSLTSFQTNQLLQGQTQNLVLGQYALLELLGEGGMGKVYKARHQRMKRIVALKVIRANAGSDPRLVRRFNQEIEAAAQVAHPNVIMAHDANEVDGTLFFVMEFIDGIDLGKLVQLHGRQPVGLAADWIRQAALGLHHVHEKGLVHRDIKPSNLLLTYAGALIKILDLGLARLRPGSEEESGAQPLTGTGMIMGTADFISPEQGRDSHRVDARSDIYSLGCTLYFLLTGYPPFVKGTYVEKLVKHFTEEPPPLSYWDKELPDELAQVVQKMMAKNPDDRYQTGAAVAQALQSFATPLTTAEQFRPAPAPQQADPHGTGATAPVDSQQPIEATRDKPLPSLIAASSGTQPVSVIAQPPATEKLSEVVPKRARPTAQNPNLQRHTLDDSVEELPVRALVPEPRSLAPTSLEATHIGQAPASPARGRSSRALLAASLLFAVSATALAGYVIWGRPAAVPTTQQQAAVNPVPTTPREMVPTPPPPTVPATKATPKIDPPPMPPPPLGIIRRIPDRDAKTKRDVLRAGLSRDGKWLAAGYTDALRVYDLEKADESHIGRLSGFGVLSLAVGADARTLLGASELREEKGKVARLYNFLGLWDPRSNDDPRSFPNNDKEVHAVAFSAQGTRGLAGTDDGTLYYWDLRGGKELAVLPSPTKQRVMAVAISADGRYALSGGRDSKVQYWDLNAGTAIHAFEGHKGFITGLAFAPDGQSALSCSTDGSVRAWDLAKRAPGLIYKGHTGTVHCVAFAHDSRRFLSGGADSKIFVWDRTTDDYITVLEEHSLPVLDVAVTPNNQYALSISEDRTCRRWPLPPAKKP